MGVYKVYVKRLVFDTVSRLLTVPSIPPKASSLLRLNGISVDSCIFIEIFFGLLNSSLSIASWIDFKLLFYLQCLPASWKMLEILSRKVSSATERHDCTMVGIPPNCRHQSTKRARLTEIIYNSTLTYWELLEAFDEVSLLEASHHRGMQFFTVSLFSALVSDSTWILKYSKSCTYCRVSVDWLGLVKLLLLSLSS